MQAREHRLQRPVGVFGQLLALAVGLALTVFAFLMLAAFAIAAIGFALIGLVRMWWLGRDASRQSPEVLTVEYTVQRPGHDAAETALPPNLRRR